MNLDGLHKLSGNDALHVHIDNAVTAGGRLFADGAQPIFATKPTHVYGRMMMYIDPNGTSVHWTFFGVNGNAEPGSPVAGQMGADAAPAATALVKSLRDSETDVRRQAAQALGRILLAQRLPVIPAQPLLLPPTPPVPPPVFPSEKP